MGGPERDVRGYITTYRTMQPVGHPLTTQILQVDMVHAQPKRCKRAKIGFGC